MRATSIIAIYFLFWVAMFFLLLPFGVRTDEEMGRDKVPGQADSAPHHFHFGRHALKATVASALLFALYYANWSNGWLTVDDLDFYN